MSEECTRNRWEVFVKRPCRAMIFNDKEILFAASAIHSNCFITKKTVC